MGKSDPEQQALQWLVILCSGETSAREREAWQHWLASSVQHQQAWQRIARLPEQWQDLPATLAAPTLRQGAASRSRRKLLQGLGLLAGVSLVGYSSQRHTTLWADISSRTGEQRQLTLQDGSQLLLNTHSAANLDFTAHERRITLLRGEIQLVSATDPRPMRVITAQGYVQAHASRFVVRQHDDRCEVALFEGALDVQPDTQAQRIPLQAGQQLQFSKTQGQITPLDGNRYAWIDGKLIAERMRLADFLAELSRYRTGLLHCDPQVAGLMISGVFPLADSDAILQALPAGLPVRLRRFSRYWTQVLPDDTRA